VATLQSIRWKTNPGTEISVIVAVDDAGSTVSPAVRAASMVCAVPFTVIDHVPLAAPRVPLVSSRGIRVSEDQQRLRT
jgi:hypothetical protein